MGCPALRPADILADFQADLDRYQREVVDAWRGLDEHVLTARPGPKRWSAIDCLEHVRRANSMYVRHLDRAIAKAERKGRRPVEEFRPGAVGARMRASLAPRPEAPAADGRARIALKMPTAGAFNPVKDAAPPQPAETLQRFEDQLALMRQLARRCETIDLRVRSQTLLGPFLMLKVGDVLRYLGAHTDRHLVQAERAMDAAGGASTRGQGHD